MLIICPHCNQQFPYKTDKEYTETTILVEGADDEMLIHALIHARGLEINGLTIEPKNGYSSILQRLKQAKRNSGYTNIKKLVAIADANAVGVQARFQEIIQAIDAQAFSLPTRPGELSLLQNDKKQCGVFLFPDNVNNGIIEDLCLQALKHPDKISCIDDHISCIQHKGLLQTHVNDLPKTKFHLYMSTSAKPTGSIGGATQAGEIDLQSSVFDTLVQFLQEL